MEAIKAKDHTIFFNSSGYSELNKLIENSNFSKIFILTDNHTYTHCLPVLKQKIVNFKNSEILKIQAGEEYKNLEICQKLWQQLCDLEADRNSLILNLGGGVITDLGGFVAATLKRGISFINIPTTLLGMVDAAIGGKTGVNLGVLKNQVGCFANPEMILIDTDYLKSLPKRHMRSGMAEIIKYGLSYDADLFNYIVVNLSDDIAFFNNLIYRSVKIKNEVVLKDPREQDLRKVLNFGHSLGHAIESYFLNQSNRPKLTHGESVAVGMIAALYLSVRYCNFNSYIADDIKEFILSYFGKVELSDSDYKPIIDLLKHDKKVEKGIVKFILIKNIGQFKLNCEVNNEALIQSLNYYST